MTRGRFLLAWAVVFALWMAGSFVVHGLLLGGDYAALVGRLYRPPEEAQRYFGWLVLAHVLMAGAFVWIYGQGVADRPALGQGVRYGLAVALLSAVPWYLIYYVVQPTPPALVVKQAVLDAAVIVLLGVAVAWLHDKLVRRSP